LNGLKLDVIHHPFTVLNPRGLNIPSVLTFWDMQQEFYPQFFSPAELHLREKTYKPSAKEATRIIVSSEFTKQCLIERYKILSKKIDVIYIGYAPEYGILDDFETLRKVKLKYNLTKPFMYCPAATWPHKNHKTLLSALRLLKVKHSFDGLLVLTGIAIKAQSEILEEIAWLGLIDMVRILGYLSYDELPYLYNLARMMVFPSLFEGFGIPLVEAMACGCPILCSNVTSIPEVVGHAGVMFDPLSSEEMAQKIWDVWNDDSRLAEMRAQGIKQVKKFNWEETARKTLGVYKKAFEG
jgi:glycosyltransferase involved in cell wall biosynthesis